MKKIFMVMDGNGEQPGGGQVASPPPSWEIIKLASKTDYFQPKQITFNYGATDKTPPDRKATGGDGGTTLVPKWG